MRLSHRSLTVLAVAAAAVLATTTNAVATESFYRSCSNSVGPGSGSVETSLHLTRGSSGYLLETGVIRFSNSSDYVSKMLVRAYSGTTSVYWNEITQIPNNTNTYFTFSGSGVVSRYSGGKVVYSPDFPNIHDSADGCWGNDAYATDSASMVYQLLPY